MVDVGSASVDGFDALRIATSLSVFYSPRSIKFVNDDDTSSSKGALDSILNSSACKSCLLHQEKIEFYEKLL